MMLRQIAAVLDAQWLSGEEEGDRVIHSVFASDMMSDVLAYVQDDTLLLTGLVNSQSIRTAEMLDLPGVIFVRGKSPLQETVVRAQSIGMPVLCTQYTMFEACGRLYNVGMVGVEVEESNEDEDV